MAVTFAAGVKSRCVLLNSSISNNTQASPISLLTMRNSAMGQNQNVSAVSHVVRDAPDTQTVS